MTLAARQRAGREPLPVHVIVDRRPDGPDDVRRRAAAAGAAARSRTARSACSTRRQANKELIRNLAHEIKNPLGGIRGAAQLLEMESRSRAT